MVAKSGDYLLLPEAVNALKQQLIPNTRLITPNLPEAIVLTGSSDEMETLADKLLALGPHAVLLKGGHQEGPYSNDLYRDQTGHSIWLKSPRIESKNTHGTGCTLSAAIAAHLALGEPLIEACRLAKNYVSGAILAAQHSSVGQGQGPVHHFYDIWPK